MRTKYLLIDQFSNIWNDEADIMMNATTKVSVPPLMPQRDVSPTVRAYSQPSIYEDAEEDEPLSQTDERIRTYGDANDEVAGSQSMLSQELMSSYPSSSQPEGTTIHGEDEEETSSTLAKRLGILTQEDDAEQSPRQKVRFSPPNKPPPPPPPEAQPKEESTTEEAEASASVPSTNNAPEAQPKEDTFAEAASATMATATTSGGFSLRDTPIRQSECFGSLLDAVQKITEQEEVHEKLYSFQQSAMQDYTARVYSNARPRLPSVPSSGPLEAFYSEKYKDQYEEETDADVSTEGSMEENIHQEGSPKRKTPPAAFVTSEEIEKNKKKQRKEKQRRKEKIPASKKRAEQLEAQETAKRAAALAEQTVADPEMAKKLLLSMALVRENPRSEPSNWPARGSIVREGFFWAHYPPLEFVLKKHMAEYYELSTTKCQSAQQQAFNNNLVVIVKAEADRQEWIFDPRVFSDKTLRDRIRCYYKTHIQNAKKRLRTMIRNPTKRANARHLCAHLDLIETNHERKKAKQAGAYKDEDSSGEDEDEENERENMSRPRGPVEKLEDYSIRRPRSTRNPRYRRHRS